MAGTFRRGNNTNIIITHIKITNNNKRQVGELERITRKNNRSGRANASGQCNHMSPLELQLLKTMSKVEMQGKQGRKVAVFFY